MLEAVGFFNESIPLYLDEKRTPHRQRKACKKLETGLIKNDLQLIRNAIGYVDWTAHLPTLKLYPLEFAAERFNLEIIKLLIKKIPHKHQAEQSTHALSILFDKWPEHETMAALPLACLYALLPDNKLSSQRDDNNIPWLFRAVSDDRLYLVERMLAIGADPFLMDDEGCLFVQECIKAESYEVVKFLLNRDKRLLNLPDKSGNTPLHIAVSCGNVNLMNYLREIGANAFLLNQEGHSPVSLSQGQKETELWGSLVHENDLNKNIVHIPLKSESVFIKEERF